jgi:hypothetical protein
MSVWVGSGNQKLEEPNGLHLNQKVRAGPAVALGQKARQPPELRGSQSPFTSLEQLRERMPSLRQREQTLRAELQAIADQTNDRAKFLRLAETLGAFLARLRSAATTLDVIERQRIVRLVVKEVLIGDDSIVIRHSIPGGPASPPSGGLSGSDCGREVPTGGNYLMRSGSDNAPLRGPSFAPYALSFHFHRGLQPSFDVQ